MSHFCLAILLALSPAHEGRDHERYTRVASRIVEAINKTDPEAFRCEFDDWMLQQFPPEKTREFLSGLCRQYGKVRRLGEARLLPLRGAAFRAECGRGGLEIKLYLNPEDRISGMTFERALPIPEKNDVPLALPFHGRWLVCWGGDSAESNHHHHLRAQCFAFDFSCVGQDGKTHKNDGLRNEDYYGFGSELLAPARGVVTDVIDGVRDNTPGSVNPHSSLGNAVFIQHGPNEIAVLAHLQMGSIRVKVGDRVRKGQVLGLCGNSGNSSEPHLHFHLENTPVIQDASGIKCYFEKLLVEREGKSETKILYSPVKGEVVNKD